ncbi:DUF4350 domain-containing protein [Cryobacterium sp. TMT2-18-3]|uniref:DUF4350 domain-containing protein n=1 Tax=unclassified Cryobacterium TaxID=2649013 RepID=UPI00106A42CF|nr:MULTISPECIES: DUF4350 domain-containing protein [unclassified Cryobacterium]TFC29846.1 DUF4350 domain-containing protein [Cryobacterium sp. TMT2-18-2]TFC35801.1 DUF4350 domain-containing protein [Cryobacterium sp. TMT2-42-4]TFC61985.1 DUF4350 domain-containing protein [Cryobacterium sp. TMT2-18-3]
MSLLIQTASPSAENAVSSTPTLREAGRRARYWLLAGVGALIVAVVSTVLAAGGGVGGKPLEADSAAPAGARALVEVLRRQGVDVTAADTLAEARSLAGAAADPTVFFFDESGYLTDDQLSEMSALAPRTVVASPDFLALQTLTPSVGFGGVSQTTVSRAACTVAAAVKADKLSPGGSTLTIPADATELSGCFTSGENAFALVEQATADRTLTLLADGTLFSNEQIGQAGNAALALNLLGAGDALVWYLPTIADVPGTGTLSLGELTPGWVTPTLILLVLVTVAAAVWRGRRFGPLVADNLPVTVRASETMEGRARLYARSNARLRALDALRVGAVQRLAVQVGLSRLASLDDVIAMVATVVDRPPADVRTVLVDAVPASDSDLVALSDRIQEIERATARATTPLPPGRMDS